MACTGHVNQGLVVLDQPDLLPEGVEVEVQVVQKRRRNGGRRPPRLHKGNAWRALLALAGTARGLPPDFAENHDHYIHGAAKR